MYYDVVCSVYEENENGLDCRVDSHLICGGFDTCDSAMDYIDLHDCTEYDNIYDNKENFCTCIEIEEHNEDGSINSIMVVG